MICSSTPRFISRFQKSSLSHFHFTHEETEGQRSEVTCLGSSNRSVPGHGQTLHFCQDICSFPSTKSKHLDFQVVCSFKKNVNLIESVSCCKQQLLKGEENIGSLITCPAASCQGCHLHLNGSSSRSD